jgi:hypothetical protein
MKKDWQRPLSDADLAELYEARDRTPMTRHVRQMLVDEIRFLRAENERLSRLLQGEAVSDKQVRKLS